ncbi:hypothetical protein OFM15_33725, partial [Escherichia coli]|nr:hypothetical protein [Escherichia coli]
VQARLCNPDKKIVVLEKYADYQRNNNLKLDEDSLNGIPEDSRLLSIVKEWKETLHKYKTLPTNLIENRLKELAQKLGI